MTGRLTRIDGGCYRVPLDEPEGAYVQLYVDTDGGVTVDAVLEPPTPALGVSLTLEQAHAFMAAMGSCVADITFWKDGPS